MEEMIEETVTMSTQMFAEILAIVNVADEAGILPDSCKDFQKTVYDLLSFPNGWSKSKRDSLISMVKARFEILRTRKFLEDGMEERETETETNATEYDHPQRYTGEDGKDLIEGECGRFWVSERELKLIKLPFLATKERKIYDENVNVPLKIEMFRCDDNGKRHLFDTKYDYKIIEAIVKGGYNK